HHEALAHELAGRFYLQRGFETAGSAHLRHARACYALWGADGKVRQLDELYPHLYQAEPAPEARGTIGAPIEHLELATVLNVSQAVSGELVLEKLVEMLLRTAIEHAGAERGLLIVPRGGDLSIQAEATTSGSSVRVRLCEAHINGFVMTYFDVPMIEANDAFLDMIGYSRDERMAARLRWTARTPPERDAATQRGMAQIRAIGRYHSYEKEFSRKDGNRV